MSTACCLAGSGVKTLLSHPLGRRVLSGMDSIISPGDHFQFSPFPHRCGRVIIFDSLGLLTSLRIVFTVVFLSRVVRRSSSTSFALNPLSLSLSLSLSLLLSLHFLRFLRFLLRISPSCPLATKTPGEQMAALEAQIRASISSATSMFSAAPPTVPPAVAAGVAAAAANGGGNGTTSVLPKKAKDHTLRCVRRLRFFSTVGKNQKKELLYTVASRCAKPQRLRYVRSVNQVVIVRSGVQ